MKLSAKEYRNKIMVGESSKSTMKKGKKAKVAETINDKDNSKDTLDREIDDFYKHKEDSEAAQEEEDYDEVNKAKTNDDVDDDDKSDDGSQYNFEPREKKNTPIPTPPKSTRTHSSHDILHVLRNYFQRHTTNQQQPSSSNPDKPLQDIPLEDMIFNILTRMYTKPQLQTQHPRLFAKLLKSEYHIQKLQQNYRGHALCKRPHDDHRDDDQHEGEKAKRPHTICDFSSMPNGNTNTKEVSVQSSKKQRS
ncbi:hypothetical protein Tco_0736688 [Tanacetum coccineum]